MGAKRGGKSSGNNKRTQKPNKSATKNPNTGK